MRKQKLTPTTKTVDDLYQLNGEGRLDLRPDYQRNSVWPPRARAYLVDTILMDRPVPMLFVARLRDPNTNKMSYKVIDGQQRLRAAFAYLENRFSATESKSEDVKGRRFKRLPTEYQDQFMGYSFVVMEMSGYSEAELRDIFARINKYVVPLNLQELRDAEHPGAFKDFVDELAKESVWTDLEIFSSADKKRKRDKELIAELVVLLLDGPQDKKGSLELYYAASAEQLDDTEPIRQDLLEAADFTKAILDRDTSKLLQKRPGYYGLMGALFDLLGEEETRLRLQNARETVAERLSAFAAFVHELPPNPSDYVKAPDIEQEYLDRSYLFKDSLSRQTDNLRPRSTRIQIIKDLIGDTLAELADA